MQNELSQLIEYYDEQSKTLRWFAGLRTKLNEIRIEWRNSKQTVAQLPKERAVDTRVRSGGRNVVGHRCVRV